jgi:hypothetical protein
MFYPSTKWNVALILLEAYKIKNTRFSVNHGKAKRLKKGFKKRNLTGRKGYNKTRNGYLQIIKQ